MQKYMTNYKTDPKYVLPSPEWFYLQFGIQWDGQYATLGSNTAHVVKIQRVDPDETLVIRISDPSRISQDRISQIHRFQAYLKARGVFTVLPYETPQGETFSTTESGFTIEVYPFIHGRSPQRGDFEDARLVARAVARLHHAGVDYLDLPGEESLFQNHVALEQLREDVRRTKELSKGKVFYNLYMEYTEETERWIAAIQALRTGLIETSLHLDTGPQNMIIDADGQLWFIDCNHMLRGRRVFEVCVSIYYMDCSSEAPLKAPHRYQGPDLQLETVFLDEYKGFCEPPWTSEENQALNIERMLMLIHGATYWASRWDEKTVREELIRFGDYRQALRANI